MISALLRDNAESSVRPRLAARGRTPAIPPWCCRSLIQIGPVQIEPVMRRLLRVRRDLMSRQCSTQSGTRGGSVDGTRRCFWVPAAKLRKLETELRASADLFRLS